MKGKRGALGALSDLGGLVYSSESGRMCPNCRRAQAQCSCAADQRAAEQALRPVSGSIRVQLDSKGRGGKSVTVVRGLPLADADLAVLAKTLKAACGAGGTVKDGCVEVQGDHVATLLAALAKLGYSAKRSGG